MDPQEEDPAGVLGSNSIWKQKGKEESCKRIRNNSQWRELDGKGRIIEEFGIESSMIVYDSYKIAVLL
jgi:hypothetical protein